MACQGGPTYGQIQDKKIQELEILLCSTCRYLETQNYDFGMNPSLHKFWDKHKKEDEAKEKEEYMKKIQQQMCKALLNKPFKELTKEEIKLLKNQGYLNV